MTRARSLLALCVTLGLASLARADSLRDAFERGNRAYARGELAGAIDEYRTLREAGVDDPDVCFNLGNALARAARYGEAIAAYECTLRLSPTDDAARRNEKLARDALAQRQALETGEAIVADRPPLSEALFARLTVDAVAWILLAGVWLASLAGFALLALRAEGARLGAGIAAVLGFVLASFGGLGLLVKTDWGEGGSRAVAITERAAVREGPDESARLSDELPEGTPVRVLAREGGYVRVRIGREREGYMRAGDVAGL